MKKRLFGSMDWTLPEITFGGASISGEGKGYGFGAIDEKSSIELLRKCFDHGIELFDTAPIYGFGSSEIRIGKAFKELRSQVKYISKSGIDWHKEGSQKGRVNRTNNPQVTKRMLHESLERLQSDYIDLYFIHKPDERVDIREPMEVLSRAKKAGKIRAIGLSTTTLEDLKKAEEIDRVDAVQSALNFFDQEVLELFPYLKEKNIAFMSYGTLDKGILTGRVTQERKFDSYDLRSQAKWWKKSPWLKKAKVFSHIKEELLDPHGFKGLDLALSYNLQFSELSTCLCGGRTWEQWEELIYKRKDMPRDLLEAAEKMRNDYEL